MSLNKVHLVGRVGHDPEVKYFESGKVVCNFAIAVNRTKTETDWFDLEIWDKTAEVAKNYVREGSLIGVTGSLKFDRWNDRTTGDERQKPVIRVDKLDLLGSKKDDEANSNANPAGNGYDDF